MKKLVIITYITLIICMAAATVAGSITGPSFAAQHIYGSWWFTALWTVLAVAATAYMVRRKVRKPYVVVLHLSLAVIMAGALTTHLAAHRGTMHITLNQPTRTYLTDENGAMVRQLPFSLTLDTFNIVYHEGTDAVADYESVVTVNDGGNTERAVISMNNTLTHRGVRFYQTAYDSDGNGSILTVSSDACGTAVSYTGYAMLFVSLIWMLMASGGTYRLLLRRMRECNGMAKVAVTALLITAATAARADTTAAMTADKATARQFGQLLTLHNSRICPLQTFAIDFTRRLCGRDSYKGLSGEQVVMGFLFNGGEWCDEPVIHIKGREMRARLSLPEHASVNFFFDTPAASGTAGDHAAGYKLRPYVNEYLEGNDDDFHRQVSDIDDCIQMVNDLRRGALLRIFPHKRADGVTSWLTTMDISNGHRDTALSILMTKTTTEMAHAMHSNDTKGMLTAINAVAAYQETNGRGALPSALQRTTERLYNAVPFTTILFIFNIMAGAATAAVIIARRRQRQPRSIIAAATLLPWLAITLCLAMRWIVSATVPMTNGYETMILLAWMVTATALIAGRRAIMLYPAGLIMSAFFLLVAHMGMMNPQITHVMPVLKSPLLCIHVSIIMMAFALLSMTFVTSIMALMCRKETAGQLHLMNLLMLYPAVALLATGIITGAIWANISWGAYWSWDPKEVWALITLMVYAPALHTGVITETRRQRSHSIYMVMAFMTILMTYFGCNYLLGGMHSYA